MPGISFPAFIQQILNSGNISGKTTGQGFSLMRRLWLSSYFRSPSRPKAVSRRRVDDGHFDTCFALLSDRRWWCRVWTLSRPQAVSRRTLTIRIITTRKLVFHAYQGRNLVHSVKVQTGKKLPVITVILQAD